MTPLILWTMIQTAYHKCASALVADDPYQFNDAPQAWVDREINRLEVKERWGRLTDEDANTLRILRGELKFRRMWQ